jgi:peptidoglycan/xylan/chitin deacetylase (PgdA/CDA1 family)
MNFQLAGVPVFVYHAIAEKPPRNISYRERKYWVSREELASQLRSIRDGGHKYCSLAQFWKTREVREQQRQVVVTFDDGNASDYHVAFRALAEHHISADFFLNTAHVGRAGFLTWAEIGEMTRSGMVFHSHAHDHVYLSRLSADRAKEQMERSKKILEDRLGSAVSFIAAPYGDFNRRVLDLAEEIGYLALCTGRSLPAKRSRRVIDRTVVYGGMSASHFEACLRKSPLAYTGRLMRAGFKLVPKWVWIQFRRQEVTF